MNEVATVFSAEFVRRFRSRVFVVGTLAGVVLIGFILLSPSIFNRLGGSSRDRIVLAGAPALRDAVAARLLAKGDFKAVERVDALPPAVTPAYLDAHHKASAAIALSVRSGVLHLDVYPRDLASYASTTFRDLVPINLHLLSGLPTSTIEHGATVDRTLHAIDPRFPDAQTAIAAHGVAFGLVFIIYLGIVLAAQGVMAAVAEEKTNRIAEILVATISPANLLAGKTLAAGALALVQIGAWIATALLTLPRFAAVFGAERGATGPPPPVSLAAVIDPLVMAAFLVFFVLCYFQYASIYAAAASLITRTEDLGSVTMPIVMPVVFAFVAAQFAMVEPNAPFAVATSFIPFVSPFVIFTRIAVSEVPAWQVLLALLINAASVAAAFYLAGKIYRVGMLLYGKMPSPKQILAALRA